MAQPNPTDPCANCGCLYRVHLNGGLCRTPSCVRIAACKQFVPQA